MKHLRRPFFIIFKQNPRLLSLQFEYWGCQKPSHVRLLTALDCHGLPLSVSKLKTPKGCLKASTVLDAALRQLIDALVPRQTSENKTQGKGFISRAGCRVHLEHTVYRIEQKTRVIRFPKENP